jgi:prolyl-tRNA synthetase
VPIIYDESKEATLAACKQIEENLRAAGLRVKLDDREWFNAGYKRFDWELRGVPVRIEVGPKDLANNSAFVARRDSRDKVSIALDELPVKIEALLSEVQAAMLAQAEQFVRDNTTDVATWDEFQEVLESKKGFIRCGWDGTKESEAAIKEATKATIRCIPLEGSLAGGSTADAGLKDIKTGAPAQHKVLFARAY